MNTKMKSPSEFEADQKSRQKDGFDRWMDQPATRMMMSMIPPSERPEVLETLLKETFNAGFGAGTGATAGSFLEAMIGGLLKDKRDGA